VAFGERPTLSARLSTSAVHGQNRFDDDSY